MPLRRGDGRLLWPFLQRRRLESAAFGGGRQGYFLHEERRDEGQDQDGSGEEVDVVERVRERKADRVQDRRR